MANMHAIAESIGPGDLVFDIGAHAGDKAAWFLAKGARVVCVEPQPNVVQVLRQRLAGKSNVTIIQKGMGRQRGTMNMSICSKTPVISTFSDSWKKGRFVNAQWDQIIPVEIITLDDLVAEHGSPKFCKIDVEGFELEVLHGLSSKIGCISFEFTSEFIRNAQEAIDHLIKIGYTKFNVSIGEAAAYQLPEYVSKSQLLDMLLPSSKMIHDLWGDIYAL
jgi:FkbM family methyltransferase